mmetsp:Transcript_47291/g.115457  ORF Transcript_47291/g.115457 Transcript_47291/m.115457 type:complete len:127 (-) Transcript_47291:2728-3108(-)
MLMFAALSTPIFAHHKKNDTNDAVEIRMMLLCLYEYVATAGSSHRLSRAGMFLPRAERPDLRQYFFRRSRTPSTTVVRVCVGHLKEVVKFQIVLVTKKQDLTRYLLWRTFCKFGIRPLITHTRNRM